MIHQSVAMAGLVYHMRSGAVNTDCVVVWLCMLTQV